MHDLRAPTQLNVSTCNRAGAVWRCDLEDDSPARDLACSDFVLSYIRQQMVVRAAGRFGLAPAIRLCANVSTPDSVVQGAKTIGSANGVGRLVLPFSRTVATGDGDMLGPLIIAGFSSTGGWQKHQDDQRCISLQEQEMYLPTGNVCSVYFDQL